MLIFIKNVDWSQTQSEVVLNIPIRGRKSAEDVVIADKFIKINIFPYFYEVFFEHPILAEQSSCKIFESNIKCHLKKATDEWWQELGKTAKEIHNDGTSNGKKQEILKEYEESVREGFVEQRKERDKLKRSELDKEIDRQIQLREKIENAEAQLNKLEIVSVILYCKGCYSVIRSCCLFVQL